MRIGNNLDMPQNGNVAIGTTNYSKADFTRAIRLDITEIGKDTGLIVDQGRSLQDVMEAAGALDVQTAQDYMTVMSNTVSEEDYAKMCDEGFDPSKLSEVESATILDHIKAVMAQSGQIVEGYNDNLDMDTLVAITGSQVDANSLANAMKQADIPVTEENAKEIDKAAKEISEITSITDSSIKYMLENGLQPTIDNIYRSNFSSIGDGTNQARGYYALSQGYLAKKADTADIAAIQNDIQKAVDKFGIDSIATEKQMEEANWLIERGIDITRENILRLDNLMSIKLPGNYEESCRKAAFSIANGRQAKEANLASKYESVYEEAVEIAESTSKIDEDAVEKTIASGHTLNLRNLWRADSFTAAADFHFNAEYEASVVNGRLALEEVRLQMTLDVNVSMLKRGMAIDTMPLTELVDQLKQEQQNLNSRFLGEGDETSLEIKAEIYKTTQQAVKEIPYLPAAVMGRIRVEEGYSLTKVHEAGTELKAKYEAAGQSYETLMTAPRRDMGDSIQKAFRNVDDILNDLGLATDDANRKAVRILGYNSMAIDASEIERIREATARVENVVNNMTPAKTLELIREGINPMDMSIDDLSALLEQKTVEESTDKYSKFLYKLEKSNAITDSERNAFIGIYRLMNRLEKTDGAVIARVANDNSITFRSLLTGMRSSKVKLDVSIDDNFGFLDETIKKGISISDQIEQAFTGIAGKEAVDKLEAEYEAESYKEYMEVLDKGTVFADELAEAGEAVTVNNLAANIAMSGQDTNMCNLLKEFSKKLRDFEEEEIADEYDESATNLIKHFDDRENAMEAYQAYIDVSEKVTEQIQYTADSVIDLKQISLCHKQLALAGNLAKQDNYTVPMMINGVMSAVNLTVKHDEDNKGNVTARFTTEAYGEISAQFTVENDTVTGLLITEKKEGMEHLKQVAEKMSQQTDGDIRAIVGKASNVGKISKVNADNNNVDTKTLYSLAKSFLTIYSEA